MNNSGLKIKIEIKILKNAYDFIFFVKKNNNRKVLFYLDHRKSDNSNEEETSEVKHLPCK